MARRCVGVDDSRSGLCSLPASRRPIASAINVAGIVGTGIAPSDVVAALEAMACRAALACGLERTIANVDLRWTARGARVLEVNGRPGGELLPHLAFLASGIRSGQVLADVTGGQRPAPRPQLRRAAGVAILALPHSMEFGELVTPPDLKRSPWLSEVRASVERGVRGAAVTPPSEDPGVASGGRSPTAGRRRSSRRDSTRSGGGSPWLPTGRCAHERGDRGEFGLPPDRRVIGRDPRRPANRQHVSSVEQAGTERDRPRSTRGASAAEVQCRDPRATRTGGRRTAVGLP